MITIYHAGRTQVVPVSELAAHVTLILARDPDARITVKAEGR